ncbi:MAG TPA: RICIN domain-containing protein [Polyangiaceae bacterium]
MWTSNGGNNQRWRLAPAISTSLASQGYYNLVNVNSGLVLDVPGAAALNAGTTLDQYGANTAFNGDGANQAWMLIAEPGGFYVLQSAEPSGPFVVDVQGAGVTPGSAAIQNNVTGAPTLTQQWRIVPVN